MTRANNRRQQAMNDGQIAAQYEDKPRMESPDWEREMKLKPTIQECNLSIGRIKLAIKRHEKACAQCAAAETTEEWCDARGLMGQNILDIQDDISELNGGTREWTAPGEWHTGYAEGRR